MIGPVQRAVVLLLVLAGAAGGSVVAVTGTVADELGRRVEGARVCYLVAAEERECTSTDRAGRFELPDLPRDTIRVILAGFLPEKIPAADRGEPVVLRLAATLLVRVRDANDDTPIGEGEGAVLYSSGHQRRFRFNAAGARVRTLAPEVVRVLATAPGYVQDEVVSIPLEGGLESEVVVRLRKETPPSAERDGNE